MTVFFASFSSSFLDFSTLNRWTLDGDFWKKMFVILARIKFVEKMKLEKVLKFFRLFFLKRRRLTGFYCCLKMRIKTFLFPQGHAKTHINQPFVFMILRCDFFVEKYPSKWDFFTAWLIPRILALKCQFKIQRFIFKTKKYQKFFIFIIFL